jgi:hypothetical protein
MKTDRERISLISYLFLYFCSNLDSDSDTDNYLIHIRIQIVSVTDTNNEYRIQDELNVDCVGFEYFSGY